MVTRKKTTKKKTTLTWGKAVKGHPVSGGPCAGRPMSQRDQKLFTKMGKRRAGVTLKKIKDAYGSDYDKLAKAKKKRKPASKKKATAKRKTTAKRKPAAKKRKTTKRKTTSSKRRTGKIVRVHGLPSRPQKYVIVDGRMRYETSSRLLSTARKRQKDLEEKFPRKKFRIVMLEQG